MDVVAAVRLASNDKARGRAQNRRFELSDTRRSPALGLKFHDETRGTEDLRTHRWTKADSNPGPTVKEGRSMLDLSGGRRRDRRRATPLWDGLGAERRRCDRISL